MKIRFLLSVVLLLCCCCLPAFAGDPAESQIQQTANAPQVQQAADIPLAGLPVINSSENPDFVKAKSNPGTSVINTVKTLVPYEDLYKVLQQDVGKYFILPIEEFEALKKGKEAWLASSSAPAGDLPPLLYQVNSARLSGHLEDNFAYIDAQFKVDTFTDAWHEIPIMWGSLAVEAVTLNGKPTTLKTSWYAANARQVQFGKMSRQNILQNVYQNIGVSNDTLSQNNWKDAMFSLPIKGKGTHECHISFVVPVQNIDDLYTMQFNMTRIPLAFLQMKSAGFILSIDSTTFKDFSVEENAGNNGCEFIGWLGANSDLSIKWRRKFSLTQTVKEEPAVDGLQPDTASATVNVTPDQIEQPRAAVQPLIYVRSHTLASLGETAIYAFKTFDYTISKAPVSSFSFNIPNEVEISSVNADRPHSYRMVREGNQKRLRVDFMAGREDTCQIEISYEAPVDLTSTLIGIPEVTPVGVEREFGAVAVEALTSVEVQPGNTESKPLSKGVYPLDPLEVPQPLKDRATRPLLLAYRQNLSPANILLAIKRYLDVPQQTVVADSMDVKTTFTTNKTSNTLVSMNIRNNNKQYLQLQLASGAEVISTFRSGIPVKPVNSKVDGIVQIPLEMSQTVGEPVEMTLQILIKDSVNEIKWRGNLAFAPPLVDIPVSRFSWYLYAPEDYHLYNFSGTVKDSVARKDPFFFRGFMHMLRFVWGLVSDPDSLLFGLFLGFIAMMIISRKLLFTLLTGLWNIICAIFSFIFGGNSFRLVELMIVVLIIAVLGAIAVPNFRKAREQSRDKACYANQRVLMGAVEMYNMDHTENFMATLDVDSLVSNKYLKSRPYPPESGCRYLTHGNLIENGVVYCQLHGAIEGELPSLQGSVDYARQDSAANEQKVKARRSESGAPAKMQMADDKDISASGLAETKPGSFGAAKIRGMLPIKTKFVMTKNFYTLERDLIMAEVASDGALIANWTSPSVKLSYVWASALKAGEVVAFILALFSGLYFVTGAFLKFPNKISFAALIIIFLSVIDMKLKTIGDAANIGLWLSLVGAFIWKTIWLLSFVKLPESGDQQPVINLNTHPPTSGKTSLTMLLALIGLLTAYISLPAFAAEYKEIRVMAPFQDLAKVLPAGDRAVIIPEADYKYLREIDPILAQEVVAPQEYRFEAVKYQGIIEDHGVRFAAEFKVDLFNTGWKKVSLLSTEAIPSAATMNGVPLPMTLIEDDGEVAYGFMTNASGPVTLSVNFFVPMASSEYRNTSRFTLNTIPICLSTLEITANEKDCEAWIDPGVLKGSEKLATKTVFRAILPPTSAVNFELYRNVTAPAPEEVKPTDKPESQADQPVVIEEKTRITARQHNLLYFKEGFVTGVYTYDLKIKGGAGIASLSFLLPEKIRIINVDNKLIENWNQTEKNSERRIDIVFKSRIRGNTNLTIEFEEDIQNLKDENYNVPEIILTDAEQSFGILGIGCMASLEVTVSTAPLGYSPIIAAEFLKDWSRERPEKTPYAFKFLKHPNSMALSISRPEDIEQQTAVIDRAEAMTLLNEDGYLLTRVVYEVRNNSEQFLKVKLPQIGSSTTELWSTQVAGLSVRSGFDSNLGVYNLPIVRSAIESGESKAFPVEIVYAIKTGKQLAAFNRTYVELPTAHLPISELSWVVYLPEGYELMREIGNVDRMQRVAETRFLDNSSYFASLSSYSNLQKRQKTSNQMQMQMQSQIQNKQTDRVFGMTGLLPVKFKIPTTNWPIYFTMLQIEPAGKAPYIEGMLVNARKGLGFLFQMIMIFVGALAAIGLIKIFTSERKYKWFLIAALQGAILAVAVYLKLYQADHFVQLGFSTTLTLYLLFRYFAFKPAAAEGKS